MTKKLNNKHFFLTLSFLLFLSIAGKAQSLIVNGNFSSGNTGFGSDYTYTSEWGGLGQDSVAGKYAINTQSSYVNGGHWGSDNGQVDHTSGTGNFMIVNGATNSNKRVWYQTVNVSANTTYLLSFWASNLSYTAYGIQAPAKLKVTINGTTVVDGYQLLHEGYTSGFYSYGIYTWEYISAQWNSGSSTTATIAIYDLTTSPNSNDFGIDDISFLKHYDNLNLIANDDNLSTCMGTVLVWHMLATSNDSYTPSNLPSNYRQVYIVSQPSHGTATWGGAAYNGEYIYTPTAGYIGSDSFKYRFGNSYYNTWDTATVYVTIKPLPQSTIYATACDEYTWDVNEQTYTTSGTYSYTKTSETHNVCDSIFTLELTVGQQTEITLPEQSACNSYTFNNHTYTSSGYYSVEVGDLSECPTIYHIPLTIHKSDTSYYNISICESYEWFEQTYTTNGVFQHQSTNAYGCSHLDILNLEVKDKFRSVETIEECDEYYWERSGITYHSSTIDSVVIAVPSSNCDSTFVLDLTLNHSTEKTDVQTACDTFIWIDGETYTESNNTATYTLTNVAGCDSIVTLNLTIGHTENITLDPVTACDAFEWHDSIYTESQTLTYNGTTESGCALTETLELTINHSNTSIDTQEKCDSFTWIDGHTYTESNNTATYTLTNLAGCDSVVTLNLTINYSENVILDPVTACDSYEWHDSIYTESQTLTHSNSTDDGCSFIETLELTVIHSDATIETQEQCDSFTWIDGHTYTESNNTATYTLTNTAGCDSIVTLNLTINNASAGIDTKEACDTYTWIDGIEYTTSNNTATYTLTNAAGCDSIVTLNLTINNSVRNEFEAMACNSYTWDNTEYQTSGEYSKTYEATNGCDSIVTMHLTINNDITNEMDISKCGSYTWNDVVYSEDGDYTQHFTSVAGCDSTVTIHLSINAAPTMEIEGDHMPMGGSEVQYSENSYTLSLPEGTSIDSVAWAVDCDNWQIQKLGDGSSIILYIYTHTTDTSLLTATLYNECGETTASFWIRTTYYGTEENSEAEVNIIPNPNNGNMTITLDNTNSDANVTVFDLKGNVIDNFVIDNAYRSYKYDIRTQSVGVYYFRITTGGVTKTKKVIVTR